MNFKCFLKYFLSLALITNSSLSLALSEHCIKNIGFIKNQDTAIAIQKHMNKCHETSKHQDNHHQNHIDDTEDCAECKFCSLNNHFSNLNSNSDFSFSERNVKKKQNIIKELYSLITKPKGPPPKIFS